MSATPTNITKANKPFPLQRDRKVVLPPSLTNPPNAPVKKKEKRAFRHQVIPKLIFPPSPSIAPKTEKTSREASSTPWETPEDEARWLANSGRVRVKYLRYTPSDIIDETDINFLTRLRDLYYPSSQPLNTYEEAYLQIMLDVISTRLSHL